MASAYLTTGNLSTAGNQKKWTFSAWIKKTKIGGEQWIYGLLVNRCELFYSKISFK